MEDTVSQVLLFLLVIVGGMLAGQWVRRWRLRDVMVEPSQVHDRLQNGDDVLLLDVRTEGEFTGGHAPGAVNVPLSVLPRRLSELKEQTAEYKDTPVVLMCRTDNRAAAAYQHLKRHGFGDVTIVRGGMMRWSREGLPTAKD